MMVSTGGPLYHFRRICLIEMSEMDVIVKWYELKCVFFPFDTWAHWTLHYNKSSDICANIWKKKQKIKDCFFKPIFKNNLKLVSHNIS